MKSAPEETEASRASPGRVRPLLGGVQRAAAWGLAAFGNAPRTGVDRNLLLVFSGHIVRVALGLISSAVLARGLGPAGLSHFSVVGAAQRIGGTVADLGLSSSAVQHIAADAATNPERARRTAASAARLKLLGALIVVSIAVVFTGPLTRELRLPLETGPWMIWAACLGLLATALSGIAAAVLQALHRFRPLVAAQSLNIGLTLVLMGGLYGAGRLTVVPALLVGAITALMTAVLGFRWLPPEWRMAIWTRVGLRSPESRRLLSFGRWLWVSTIISTFLSQFDLLLLNRWMAPEVVGLYALALNVSLKLDLLNQSMHMVMLPTVAPLTQAAGFLGYIRQSLRRSLLMVGLLIPALPLVGWLIPLVYGAEYSASVGVFYLLAAVILFDLIANPLLLLAFPMGMPRLIAFSDGVRLAALIGVAALLIPVWGIYGAAVARLAARVAGAIVVGAAIIIRIRRPADKLPAD